MLRSIHTTFRLNAARHTPAPIALMPLLQRWLLRCWQAQCRQAERPGRIVPRY